VKVLGRRLSRISRQLDPARGVAGSERAAGADELEAAAMKKQMVADFSCLSCDKKLLFARQQRFHCSMLPVMIRYDLEKHGADP